MIELSLEKITMIYIILRIILFLILLVGLYGWVKWATLTRSHWLLAILPLTTIIIAIIFIFAAVISRLTIVDFSSFINTWSQSLRILEFITIGAAPIIMLMVRKYE
jgi:hypothetical protein